MSVISVKYTLEFNADGLTIPDAVKKVNAELEHFLEIMEKNGVTADKFELVDNKSAEKYGHREEKCHIIRNVLFQYLCH